jgi:hypothetical protein
MNFVYIYMILLKRVKIKNFTCAMGKQGPSTHFSLGRLHPFGVDTVSFGRGRQRRPSTSVGKMNLVHMDPLGQILSVTKTPLLACFALKSNY